MWGAGRAAHITGPILAYQEEAVGYLVRGNGTPAGGSSLSNVQQKVGPQGVVWVGITWQSPCMHGPLRGPVGSP